VRNDRACIEGPECAIALLERFARQQGTARSDQVVGKWRRTRSWHVTGPRIDRLALALVPLSRARIEHDRSRIGPESVDGDLVDHVVARGERERRRGIDGLRVGDKRSAARDPSADAAVEYAPPPMTEVTEQPPEARGNGAAHVVVGNDDGVALHAEAREHAR